MSKWTSIRDLGETAAVLAGNYYLPGSSIGTEHLASKGSQQQLGSTAGKIAQIGTGLTGSGIGTQTTGIPSASSIGGGWTNTANNVGGLVGDSTLGTDVGNGIESVGNKISGGLSDAGSSIKSALGFSPSTAATTGSSFSDLLSGSGNSSGSTFANAPDISNSLSLNSPSVTSGLTGVGKDIASGISPSAVNAGLGSAYSAGVGGGSSAYSGIGGIQGIGTLLGAASSLSANDQAQKDLLKAQGNSLNAIQPYQQTGVAANAKLSQLLGTSGDGTGATTADILQASPQYQFQLQQGNQALDRQQAAKGDYFSGAALKSAQDYGQGLANQTAQQYYGNLAQQAGQGQGAANSAGNIYGQTGTAQANAGISSSNILNQTLSSLLSNSGAKRPVNIGGQVVYI